MATQLPPEHLIHWVECSRCQKWRIIPPMPDGSEEVIPEVWFCEMNRDPIHNNCEVHEQEYKASELPLEPMYFVPVPVASAKRPAKVNDPEYLRARLKTLTSEELQAAFESLDLQRIWCEEFGENFDSARSTHWVGTLPVQPQKSKAKSNPKQQPLDYPTCVAEVKQAIEKTTIPPGVKSQFTRRFFS